MKNRDERQAFIQEKARQINENFNSCYTTIDMETINRLKQKRMQFQPLFTERTERNKDESTGVAAKKKTKKKSTKSSSVSVSGEDLETSSRCTGVQSRGRDYDYSYSNDGTSSSMSARGAKVPQAPRRADRFTGALQTLRSEVEALMQKRQIKR